MKRVNSLVALAVLAATITSCRDTAKEQRYQSVDAYEAYVDSISNVGMEDLSARWDEIENTAREKRNQAEVELRAISDDEKVKEQYQQKVYATSERYDDFRNQVMADREGRDADRAVENLRSSLFPTVTIRNDRNFDWVNKDNILATYDHFVNTVADNKDDYTREDWDEIKMLWEALDALKNTVENEGLTAEDNRKIAALKVKFAPIYTINRMEEKAKENRENKNQ